MHKLVRRAANVGVPVLFRKRRWPRDAGGDTGCERSLGNVRRFSLGAKIVAYIGTEGMRRWRAAQQGRGALLTTCGRR